MNIPATLYGIPTNWLAGGVVIAIGLVIINWPKVAGLISSGWAALPRLRRTTVAEVPDRKAALDKCDDCIAFLESIGCDEGAAHFKAGLIHFYHKHG